MSMHPKRALEEWIAERDEVLRGADFELGEPEIYMREVPGARPRALDTAPGSEWYRFPVHIIAPGDMDLALAIGANLRGEMLNDRSLGGRLDGSPVRSADVGVVSVEGSHIDLKIDVTPDDSGSW